MLRLVFFFLALFVLCGCLPTDWANLKTQAKCVSTRLVVLDKTKTNACLTVTGEGLDFYVEIKGKKIIDLDAGDYTICRSVPKKCYSINMRCGIIYKIEA